MNATTNRSTTTFTPRQMTDLQAALTAVEKQLQGLVSLTPDERMTLPKISVDNRVFVTDAVNLMTTPAGASILPPFVKAADVQVDIQMFTQLETLLARLDVIRAKMNDHRILAGAEAYSSALMFKKLAEAGAEAGMPGLQPVVDTLRERFVQHGRAGTAPAA